MGSPLCCSGVDELVYRGSFMSHSVTLGGPATGPLAGVRVVDLTTIYSGPIATSILGDQGADVIKIESTDGDLMRRGRPMAQSGSRFFRHDESKQTIGSA